MPILNRPVEIIGVPMDFGANIRGACMGPASIRIAGLNEKLTALGINVVDSGDVHVPIRETVSKADAEKKYAAIIQTICEETSAKVTKALQKGHMPITIGGDHSIATGSISGTSGHLRKQGQELGLLWIDAHADLNIPEVSPSGNLHGMPLAFVTGLGFPEFVNLGGFAPKVRPENVALIGIRILDPFEKETLRKGGIRYYSMREVDEKGMHAIMKEVLKIVGEGTAGIHLSFDLDGIDPLYAPGVSTPVTGGLSYRESHLLLEMLADSGKLMAMDFVEYNPINDHASQTADLAIQLMMSALGKSIV